VGSGSSGEASTVITALMQRVLMPITGMTQGVLKRGDAVTWIYYYGNNNNNTADAGQDPRERSTLIMERVQSADGTANTDAVTLYSHSDMACEGCSVLQKAAWYQKFDRAQRDGLLQRQQQQ
jgi:hypothetical protein